MQYIPQISEPYQDLASFVDGEKVMSRLQTISHFFQKWYVEVIVSDQTQL